MSDESHFRLRIPADLKALVETAAKAEGRSINAQIIKYIEVALGQGEEMAEVRSYIDDHDERLKAVERDVQRLLDSTGIDYYERG